MVFKKEAAPKERKAFLQWYDEQVEFLESSNHIDCTSCSIDLQEWFKDMKLIFQPINGPFIIDVNDEKRASYCLGKQAIYVTFSWSVADFARTNVMKFAKIHGLGFFDISSPEGDIWFPRKGKLVVIKNPERESIFKGRALKNWISLFLLKRK